MDGAHFGLRLPQGRSHHTHAHAQQYLHYFGIEYSDVELVGRVQFVVELFTVPMEKIRCGAAAVTYLRGKISALVGVAAEVGKLILLLIALAGRINV